MDVLIIYQFCSFGGVERAILNRAKTFLKYRQDVHISVGYLYDIGALQSFQAYIEKNSLSEHISAFLINDEMLSDLENYDYVFNIDTPQIFARTIGARNIFVECHTPYLESRQYLRKLPPNIQGILVPSLAFKNILLKEFPSLPPIFVLPNPVSQEFFTVPLSTETVFMKRPLAYLARLDELKNYTEAFSIFELCKNNEDVMFAVTGKSSDEKKILAMLRTKKIIGKTFLRAQIDFDNVPSFIGMIKSHRGIFISPSRGESFGLSAAEFMSAGVPVLLSDIDAHQELVNSDRQFLYSLGDIVEAKYKIDDLLNNWDNASQMIASYAQKFCGVSFVQSWQEFIKAQGYPG